MLGSSLLMKEAIERVKGVAIHDLRDVTAKVRLKSERGTCKTVKARFWPWRSGKCFKDFLFARSGTLLPLSSELGTQKPVNARFWHHLVLALDEGGGRAIEWGCHSRRAFGVPCPRDMKANVHPMLRE